jgi:hypothetical protein
MILLHDSEMIEDAANTCVADDHTRHLVGRTRSISRGREIRREAAESPRRRNAARRCRRCGSNNWAGRRWAEVYQSLAGGATLDEALGRLQS